MNSDIEKLLKLQTIDIRIHEIQRSSEEFPQMVADLEAGIARASAAFESATKKIAGLESDKKSLLDKHQDAEAQLKRSEERLNSIKTNREYDAVHAEIETHKHTLGSTESKVAAIDASIAAAQTASDEASQAYDQIKAENEPKIAELKSKIATIDSQIAEVRKERDEVVPQITKNTLRTYEHILKKRKTGQVLATVGTGKRNCSICNKVLESQLINEARKGDRVQMCQSCGSILVWVSDPAPTELPA